MIAILTGIATGMLIFVVSSGLTLVLGVLRVVNFAHGGFFLIGAYVAYQLTGGEVLPLGLFLLVLLAAGAATALLGVVTERLLFRRLYDVTPEMMLLGTYALLLVLQGATQVGWGFQQRTQPRPEALSGSFHVLGTQMPRYDVLLVVVGLLVLAALQLLIHHTHLGSQVLAVAEDRYMASLLGIRVSRVFALTFAIGVFLAGLGGALAAPTLSMTPDLATTFILYAFAVVIIGGFGSITGSLVASLTLGLLASLSATYVPSLADFALYLPMLAILVLRPQGLRGTPAPATAAV